MAEDENLHSFVVRRERELIHQIAAIKGEIERFRGRLAQREDELARVRTIKDQLGLVAPNSLELQKVVGLPPTNSNSVVAGDIRQRFAEATIKELAIQALIDNFPNGAKLVAIRDFIQDAYGRDIMPSSLRAQMHRLKADGILGQEPADDLWNFVDGKRRLYVMYDHPTSRKGMKELRDDPTPLDDEAPAEDDSKDAP